MSLSPIDIIMSSILGNCVFTDDAERGGADHCVTVWPLAENSDKQVHVIHAGVEPLELLGPLK